MKWRTELKLKRQALDFHLENSIVSIGSCFADNIGERLVNHQFNIDSNPFGILFNPISIAKNINAALLGTLNEELILERDGTYFHYDLPSSIFGHSKAELIDRVVALQKSAKERLIGMDRFVLTFGTAWVYRELKTNEIVANCHKIPQANFQKELLDLEELKEVYFNLFEHLKTTNPDLQILLTVSPVRHINNGIHENNSSKSTLILLTDFLVNSFDFVHYFPSYELIIDDLRDYRFYKEDLIHPTTQAVDYVYNQFKTMYFSENTTKLVDLIDQHNQLAQHRPLHTTTQQLTAQHQKLKELETAINRLKIKA